MKYFWMGLALACISGAAMALWRQNYETAFVLGAVGALAWFLNYRARMKELIEEPNIHDSQDSE